MKKQISIILLSALAFTAISGFATETVTTKFDTLSEKFNAARNPIDLTKLMGRDFYGKCYDKKDADVPKGMVLSFRVDDRIHSSDEGPINTPVKRNGKMFALIYYVHFDDEEHGLPTPAPHEYNNDLDKYSIDTFWNIGPCLKQFPGHACYRYGTPGKKDPTQSIVSETTGIQNEFGIIKKGADDNLYYSSKVTSKYCYFWDPLKHSINYENIPAPRKIRDTNCKIAIGQRLSIKMLEDPEFAARLTRMLDKRRYIIDNDPMNKALRIEIMSNGLNVRVRDHFNEKLHLINKLRRIPKCKKGE